MKTTNILQLSGLALMLALISCSGGKKDPASQDTASNEKAETEVSSQWFSLFDGETLAGWKRYNADEIGPLWRVEEGAILCDGIGHGEGSGEFGGSLITLATFGNFELELEWRISEGGNSGILYHVVEKPEYSHAYVTGPEYQVTDDPPLTDDLSNDNKMAGSSYDMYAAPRTKKLNPPMEWNSTRIIYNKGKVEHWLNGEKVVEFDEAEEDFNERFGKSKWSSGDYPHWNTYKEGSIALQDHGAAVWYRNIRIRKL